MFMARRKKFAKMMDAYGDAPIAEGPGLDWRFRKADGKVFGMPKEEVIVYLKEVDNLKVGQVLGDHIQITRIFRNPDNKRQALIVVDNF